MDENQEVGFEEFMAAFDGDLGNQTGEEEEQVQEEQTDEEVSAADRQEGADSEEAPEGSPEEPAKEEAPQQENAPGESFTIKVNKEERTCTREEIISLAQKGADYDRVKEQLASHKEIVDTLNSFAKDAGTTVAELLDQMQLGLLKKQGLSDEVAQERLQRLKAEKENAALKASANEGKPAREDGSQRVRREISEFRDRFPKVELTQELLGKLMPQVAAGQSLADAYRDHEAAQKDARIAELERQIAAEKQNKANRAASPGSQRDTGGRRTKDDFDDFMSAFA